jgi:hypothetical protein
MSSKTVIKCCRKVLRIVAELHLRGYQRLRIATGMSGSGMHWRCLITPASNILVANGAIIANEDGPVVRYTSGMLGRYFDWSDTAGLTPSQLADRFVDRFRKLVRLAKGRDWQYVGWYVEMLTLTHPNHVPITNEYLDQGPESRCMRTIGYEDAKEVYVPMPPPGEAGSAKN